MKSTPTTRSSGFTLVELIVVIAAMGILLAILLPTITGGIRWAERITASSNMRQVVMAWTMYSHDQEYGNLPSSNNYALNGQPAWVLNPRGTDVASREAAIEGGALYPYLDDLEVFRDPNHVFPNYLNAYSINGFLNGEWARHNHGPPENGPTRCSRTNCTLGPNGHGVLHYDDVNGGTVVLFPEADARNYNINSFIMDPETDNWIDRVAGNYGDGDNLCFADGHTEFRRWLDQRTLQSLHTHFWRTPDSVDCDWLGTVIYPR